MPTAVTMTIAATRMHRCLADFLSHSDVCVILLFNYSPSHCSRCNNSVISSGNVPRSGHPVQLAPRDTFTIRVSTHDQLEAAVRTTSLPSPRDEDASFVTIEGQLRDKPPQLSLHEDAKSDV